MTARNIKAEYFDLFLLCLIFAGLSALGVPFWGAMIIAIVIGVLS
jgi:hypothetical protein